MRCDFGAVGASPRLGHSCGISETGLFYYGALIRASCAAMRRMPEKEGAMAKVILWGDTATEWYSQVVNLPSKVVNLTDLPDGDVRPVPGARDYLAQHFPFLSRPYRLTVFRREDRCDMRDIRCHIAAASAREAPHYLVASGVLAPSPELALLQQSRGRSLVEVAAVAAALCSAYALGPADDLQKRALITSPERIALACRRHPDVFGCGTVCKAQKWIMPNAASPREAALALVLSLPCRLGGCGLPKPMLNAPLCLHERVRGAAASSYYVADLCWPDARLVIEYDSDAFHLTSDQQYRDAVKRMVLGEMGYRVLTVTRQQLNDPWEMDKVARIIAPILGRQFRIRCKDFRAKQLALWRAAGLR